MNKMSKRVLAMAMAATMITGSSAAVMASSTTLLSRQQDLQILKKMNLYYILFATNTINGFRRMTEKKEDANE